MSAVIDSESFRELIRKWPDYAVKVLYDAYYGRLIQVAQRKTIDRKASEDIVQEAFIEVWKKSAWLADQKDLLIGSYLVGIVRNKAISSFHQASREVSRSPRLMHEIRDHGASRESEITQENTHARLRNIVAALPVRERECIQLKPSPANWAFLRKPLKNMLPEVSKTYANKSRICIDFHVFKEKQKKIGPAGGSYRFLLE